jgi:hypothetical protein
VVSPDALVSASSATESQYSSVFAASQTSGSAGEIAADASLQSAVFVV